MKKIPFPLRPWHWPVLGLLGLGIIYVGLTLGAFCFVRYHRGIDTITYGDIALPQRWPIYREKRGAFLITHALLLLRSGRFGDGFRQLRLGLGRAPDNREGRLVLAQIYADNKRPDLARQALMDGLAYHGADADYVATLLNFLLDREEDHLVIALSDRLLQNHPDVKIAQVAAIAAATACYYRGNYDRAENYLHTRRLQASRDGTLLSARIAWERDCHPLALLLLRDLSAQLPDDEAVYAQLIDYLEADHLTDEARRRAILHQVAYPDRVRSAIDQLNILQQAGDEAAVSQESGRMLQRFAANPAGLLALGDFAATHGQVDLARKILACFQQAHLSGETTVRLMVIESLLVAKNYASALAQIKSLDKESGREPRFANVCNGLEAIAHYGLGDPIAGYACLGTLIARPDLRADSLLAIANRLIAMGNPAPAREVLAKAVSLNPQNQLALARLVSLDLDTGNIAAATGNLRTLITLRQPPPTVLRRAQDLLRSDAWLFLPDRGSLLEKLSRITGTPGASAL
jgi:Tfp pilus assembly protein PilF